MEINDYLSDDRQLYYRWIHSGETIYGVTYPYETFLISHNNNCESYIISPGEFLYVITAVNMTYKKIKRDINLFMKKHYTWYLEKLMVEKGFGLEPDDLISKKTYPECYKLIYPQRGVEVFLNRTVRRFEVKKYDKSTFINYINNDSYITWKDHQKNLIGDMKYYPLRPDEPRKQNEDVVKNIIDDLDDFGFSENNLLSLSKYIRSQKKTIKI